MISTNDIASEVSLGVTKKILGQYKAFQNMGHETWNLCMENGNGVLIGSDDTRTVVKKKVKDYFTVCALFLNAPKVCKELHADLCYIRFPLTDWAFMKMVGNLHKISKVVVEIPTYPYDDQNRSNHNVVAQFAYHQDMFFRAKINPYIDLIATLSDDESIWNIKCVNIQNGLDVNQIEYLGDSLNYEKDINLVGVARVQRDHGYDRVLEGMKSYYTLNNPERKIFFHVVGEGEAEGELRALVSAYGLEQYVTFHGFQSGATLEELYKKSQLGVGILGAYRSGINKTSALKHREYCAIGIPFIGSAIDDGFPPACPFYRLFPNDSTPLDMYEIIHFFDEIKKTPGIHEEMREYAEKHFSWETQLEKVLESIKKDRS